MTTQSTETEKSQTNTVTVAVIGDIGAGKTHLINSITGELGDWIDPQRERLDIWMACHFRNPLNDHTGAINLLANYYDNPIDNALPLQMAVLSTMLHSCLQPCSKPFRIMERCAPANHLFADINHARGAMKDDQYAAYTLVYNMICAALPDHAKPSLYIYLQCSVDTSLQRNQARARAEDRNLDRDYQQQLHDATEKWFCHKTLSECKTICEGLWLNEAQDGIPTLVMDVECDKRDPRYKERIHQVVSFMKRFQATH